MIVTMATLPLLVRLANKLLIVDQPGKRKVHVTPIPRVGGIAMAGGVLAAALLTVHLQAADRWFLVGAGLLVFFGALDDRFDLDYRIKFIGQLLAVGIVAILGDVQVHTITLDDRIMLPNWMSMPLTVFFLVGVTNAINLADGLDGLAGGTGFLCLCAAALLSIIGGAGAPTALTLAFAGAVLGFLRFNTHPASVFMGDAGSQLLGFAIGVLSVRVTQSVTTQVSAALPVLLLALPILDTLSVMVQRIAEHRSPFSSDQNHIHHKLLAMGFDHHEAVMVIYTVQGGLFVLAYVLRFESDFVIIGVVSAFFAISIALLQIAAGTGWRFRDNTHSTGTAPVPRLVDAVRRSKFLPRVSYAAIAGALSAYAFLIVGETVGLSNDLRMLIIALLAVIVAFSAIMRIKPLSVVEKAALYVTATLLVYLDATVVPWNRPLSVLCWAAVALAAVGIAIRLRLFNDQRFQLTPLDLIVLFMALVVPSLPGTLGLPHGGALAIAKLIVIFYAIEMLVSRSEGKAVWVRIASASVLTALTLRTLAPF
jgi:UDP-GlcNAc:undecaprenyl-phosphate GlcNAc-1-phosphate transferase